MSSVKDLNQPQMASFEEASDTLLTWRDYAIIPDINLSVQQNLMPLLVSVD